MCANVHMCVQTCVYFVHVGAHSRPAHDEQQQSIPRDMSCSIFSDSFWVNTVPIRHGDEPHLRAKLGSSLL